MEATVIRSSGKVLDGVGGRTGAVGGTSVFGMGSRN
jgi:hypothetical protein